MIQDTTLTHEPKSLSVRLLEDGEWKDPPVGQRLEELIADQSTLVWIDVEAPPEACTSVLNEVVADPVLQETFVGIEPSKATKGGDYPPTFPPKAKAFSGAVFARAYWLRASHLPDEMRAQEVHLLVGPTFAITMRYPMQTWNMQETYELKERPPDQGLASAALEQGVVALERRFDEDQDELATRGGSFGLLVAMAVLDTILDSALDSLNTIRQSADRLEASIVRDGGERVTAAEEIARQTLHLRRLLRQVRWAFLPSDEIDELHWGPFQRLDDRGIDAQLTDLSREANRAVETTRDIIEQVEQIVDLSNTLKTDRVVHTTSLLTIIATVLLVPTLLAGIWGMNFERVPGADARLGFWGALVALVVAGAVAWLVVWLIQRKRN